jgi:hypothetical protein
MMSISIIRAQKFSSDQTIFVFLVTVFLLLFHYYNDKYPRWLNCCVERFLIYSKELLYSEWTIEYMTFFSLSSLFSINHYNIKIVDFLRKL